MPPGLMFGTVASVLSLVTFCGLLSTAQLWSSWSALTGHKVAPIPILDEPPLGTPAMLPRSEARQHVRPAVSIPSVTRPLLTEPPSGLPAMLPRAETPQPVTLTVSLPPMMPGSFAVLPAIVTPLAAGASNAATTGPIPNAPPALIVPPRMPSGPIPAVLRVPAGKGPFPAVILLHGCGGAFTGMPDWAYRLNAWGYAALMPDSLTPRGLKNVCDHADQPKVTPSDRVGDVGAAVSWLRTRAEIDPTQIAVLGLSHGGTTAALAVQAAYAGMRLRASVDYYGPCMEPWLHGSVPLLVLAGEADDWGDPASRCRIYGEALRADQPFELHTYAGAYHAFDGGSTNQTLYMGHILRRDQAAAEDSFRRVHAFLDRWVRR